MLRKIKKLALVAHDNRKRDLVEWVEWNRHVLMKMRLVCTGTTGLLVQEILRKCSLRPSQTTMVNSWHEEMVTRLKSGPLGGDQQLGTMIVEDKVDLLIFFWIRWSHIHMMLMLRRS